MASGGCVQRATRAGRGRIIDNKLSADFHRSLDSMAHSRAATTAPKRETHNYLRLVEPQAVLCKPAAGEESVIPVENNGSLCKRKVGGGTCKLRGGGRAEAGRTCAGIKQGGQVWMEVAQVLVAEAEVRGAGVRNDGKKCN